MKTSSTQDILAEVWAAKDRLSSALGHDLKATCGALYAEQQKHPRDFVNLGAEPRQSKPVDSTARSPAGGSESTAPTHHL